jgi:hypothetical protein
MTGGKEREKKKREKRGRKSERDIKIERRRS